MAEIIVNKTAEENRELTKEIVRQYGKIIDQYGKIIDLLTTTMVYIPDESED